MTAELLVLQYLSCDKKPKTVKSRVLDKFTVMEKYKKFTFILKVVELPYNTV